MWTHTQLTFEFYRFYFTVLLGYTLVSDCATCFNNRLYFKRLLSSKAKPYYPFNFQTWSKRLKRKTMRIPPLCFTLEPHTQPRHWTSTSRVPARRNPISIWNKALSKWKECWEEWDGIWVVVVVSGSQRWNVRRGTWLSSSGSGSKGLWEEQQESGGRRCGRVFEKRWHLFRNTSCSSVTTKHLGIWTDITNSVWV